MIDRALREKVRRVYNYRCGYCSVSENEVGGELEIDHFRPLAAGGNDKFDNLVYCCAICNRYKGDYWPSAQQRKSSQRLLHPSKEKLKDHLRETREGRLRALTSVGEFHIQRLRLNRPQLIKLRQNRKEQQKLRRAIKAAQAEASQLQTRFEVIERELFKLREAIRQLRDRQ